MNFGGAVVRVPKAGGSSTVLASGEAEPFGIAADASGVYWTNRGDNTVRLLAAGSTTPVTIATNTSMVNLIATDAAAVYWTTVASVMRVTK